MVVRTVGQFSRPAVEPIGMGFCPRLPVVVQLHDGQLSSDGGLLPVRQFDQTWKYTERMAECLTDAKPGRADSLLSMLRRRVFGAVAGYQDCNDHDDLRYDPVFKLIADDKLPDADAPASQPTLSRFENGVLPRDPQRLVDFTVTTGVERLIDRHGSMPDTVTLDVDPTDMTTHGSQQLTLFHGYYEQYQYYPPIISGPTTRHVFVAHLRHGTAAAAPGVDDELMRVVTKLRAARAEVKIHVRGDCGVGGPATYELCEQQGWTYTPGFSTNNRLKKPTQELIDRAVKRFEETGEKARLFDCFDCQCDSWNCVRRVIAKAECHAGGLNPRFVVTNLPGVTTAADAERTYDHHIQRGESEHRMDELKNGPNADRLGCHRFTANFFRLVIFTCAYNLTNAFRRHPPIPADLQTGQPDTWRKRVIKVAAEIVVSARRIVVRPARNWPRLHAYFAVVERANRFAYPSSA